MVNKLEINYDDNSNDRDDEITLILKLLEQTHDNY